MVMPSYGMSPYEILYGFPPRLPFMRGQKWESMGSPSAAVQYVANLHNKLSQVREAFYDIEMKLTLKRVQNARKGEKETDFKAGDQAIVWTKGTKDKLTCIWSDVVSIRSKGRADTYQVKYPNGETARVPSKRLRKYLPSGYDDEDVLGPFITDFPSFTEEGDSKGNPQDLHLLPSFKVKGRPTRKGQAYRYVGNESEDTETPEELEITYGDFVAHFKPDGGWAIAQYLGSDVDDGSIVQLRKLGTLHEGLKTKEPRTYVWRYHWLARKGKHVLSSVGREHDEQPSAKGTGGTSETWIDVAKKDIIAIVHLGEDGMVSQDSWNLILQKSELAKAGSSHLFVKSIWCTSGFDAHM
jgi:hypothetical protein